MDIRIGHAGDFAAILPMMRQCRALHAQWDAALYALRPDADARFQRWIGRAIEDPRALLIVAEQDGRIIGFMTAMVEHDWPIYEHDEFAVVRELWVEPARRGRGVAAALLERAASEYELAGIKQLRVRTAAANKAGVEMLERAGFRPGSIDLLREL